MVCSVEIERTSQTFTCGRQIRIDRGRQEVGGQADLIQRHQRRLQCKNGSTDYRTKFWTTSVNRFKQQTTDIWGHATGIPQYTNPGVITHNDNTCSDNTCAYYTLCEELVGIGVHLGQRIFTFLAGNKTSSFLKHIYDDIFKILLSTTDINIHLIDFRL